MEFLLTLIFEVVGQFLFELFFELLFRGLVQPFRVERKLHPGVAVVAYSLLGAATAGISLYFWPAHLINPMEFRILSLICNPIALGCGFEWFGRRLERKGKPRSALDYFAYGFTFALSFGLVRLVFAA